MKETSKKWISNIIWIYLFLSPIFDVITSFSIHFSGKSMPLILGIKFLFLVFLAFLNLKEKEKKSYLYIILLLFYFFVFFLLIYQKSGISSFFLEAQNLFRVFYFPCFFLFLYPLVQKGIFKINISNLCYILFLYLTFLVLPEIFHVGFASYTQGKIGGLGWYYSTNEISGILAILGPFLFRYLKSKGGIIRIIGILFYLSGILIIGTKVPILAFLITIFCFLSSFFIKLWKQKYWKKIFISFICSIVGIICFLFLLTSSSFYQNIKIHLEFLDIHHINDLFTLEHIDHFIFSERLTFLKNTNAVYHDSNLYQKLFGIGISTDKEDKIVSRKTIEMDYFDLFYQQGIIGTILFALPFFFVLWKRKYLLEEKISIFLILLLAFFSGHILVAPSVSTFVTLILLPKREEFDL